jgi:hypothetical protein
MVGVHSVRARGHLRTLFSMLRRTSVLNRIPGGMKAVEESSFSTGQEVCFRGKEFFFLTKQCGNVTENKGRPWRALGLGGNVSENKGDASRKREFY